MAYGSYKETGMIACALNAQCVESNQLMADAHRRGHEALATLHQALRYQDSLTQEHSRVCDENRRLKMQLQAADIDTRCLNSLLAQLQSENSLLTFSLQTELESRLTERHSSSMDGVLIVDD